MLDQITLAARGQALTGNCIKIASDVVNLIPCHVDLDDDWDYPVVKAVFYNGARGIAKETILDDNGDCMVPWEVLAYIGKIEVNLYAGRYDGNEFLTERLPSYKTVVIEVNQKVRVNADNTLKPTPSDFDQYVALVAENAARAEQAAERAERLLTMPLYPRR